MSDDKKQKHRFPNIEEKLLVNWQFSYNTYCILIISNFPLNKEVSCELIRFRLNPLWSSGVQRTPRKLYG